MSVLNSTNRKNYEKHNLTKSKTYKTWCNIVQRCYNSTNKVYSYYGGNGILMESIFRDSFSEFSKYLETLPNYIKWLSTDELSLDRIDGNLGYVQGNLKFSTKTEQVENQKLRVDNKSGYKGVCYHKLNKKYGATITVNKVKIFLGYTDNPLDCAKLYDNYIIENKLNRKTNLS